MTDRDRLMAVAAEAARRLNAVAQAGEAGRVNRQLIRALADEGLLGRVFPASAGGKQPARLSAVDLCLVREGLARESTAVENALTIQALGAYPIVVACSDEQIRRQVIPAVRGEAVAAFALTEPDAGTDAGALALRAERVAGGYRLSGVPVERREGLHLQRARRGLLHALRQDDARYPKQRHHRIYRRRPGQRLEGNGLIADFGPPDRTPRARWGFRPGR